MRVGTTGVHELHPYYPLKRLLRQFHQSSDRAADLLGGQWTKLYTTRWQRSYNTGECTDLRAGLGLPHSIRELKALNRFFRAELNSRCRGPNLSTDHFRSLLKHVDLAVFARGGRKHGDPISMCDTDTNRSSHAHSNGNSNENAHYHPHGNANDNSDPYADKNTDRDADRHPEPNSYPNTNGDSDKDPHSHTDGNSNGYPEPYPHTDPNGNSNKNTYSNTDRDAYHDPHADSNRHTHDGAIRCHSSMS